MREANINGNINYWQKEFFFMEGDMIFVILAGSMGKHLSEKNEIRPKPLVEHCGRPIQLASLASETDQEVSLGIAWYIP